MESLDKILSGDGASAPEAGKPSAEPETKVAAETPQPEGNEPQDEVTESNGRKMVPLEALTEARGKAKRYTEQVAEFDKTVKSLGEQNANLQRQVTELLQRIPTAPQPQPAQAPDIFENAPEAIRHTVAPQFDQINQTLLAIARDNANTRFNEDKVNEAEAAFLAAIQNRTLDPADYNKVIGSPNRYAAAVQWHQRKLAEQEIGGDPAAYREKVRADLEAEILTKYGLAPDGKPAMPATPAVMPSNLAGARNVGSRAGPAWGGPAALTDIFKR